VIVTFYSFKGGVGRSMAVANVADILARQGLRVLMIDFDLEAPGLEQYFQINHAAARRNPGLLDLLLAYKRSMSVTGGPVREPEFKRVETFIGPVYPSLSGGGCLHLMAAGQREPREQLDRYASNLRTFDWQDFYFNWEGELFFEWLRSALVPDRYDLVLVDSRTGVTEMGGICTYQLADAIVMLSAANQQNRQGTLNVAADFLSPPVQVARRDRPLDIVAVPARVEQKDPALLEAFVVEFERQFAAYLPESLQRAGIGLRDLLIPYEPAYAFEERVLSDPTRAMERRSIAGAFERIAHAVRLLMTAGGRTTAAPAPRTDAPAPAPAALQYDAAKRFAGYDVFVSVCNDDAEAAAPLVDALKQAGASVFVDRHDLLAGEDWRARTEQALFHSRACLLCVGVGARTGMGAELMAALTSVASARELPVVPVLLPGATLDQALRIAPRSLAAVQWLDLSDGLQHDEIESLLRNVIFPPQAGPPDAAAGEAHEAEAAAGGVVSFGAPYPGPRPFGEADAGFLFGHEEAQRTVLDALAAHGLAVVTGPSACGKTSLVEAGVLPALRRGDPAATWGYQRLVAERAPVVALDEALARLREMPCTRRLLFVDQLERILRHATPDEESAFLSRLHTLWHDGGAAPTIIVGVRDVRLAALDRLAPTGLLSGPHVVRVPALTGTRLREAIEKPAERAGLAFEPGLVDRIVADWGGDQRFLPFLQSVLHDLWVHRREGFLTNGAYDAIPDPVEGLAEAAFAERPDLQDDIARVTPRLLALCGNLVPLDLSCEPADLRVAGIPAEHVHEMLWHLVDSRLLYGFVGAAGETRVAPAYAREQWRRAESWHQQDEAFLDWLTGLHRHRLEWLRHGRDSGALLSGTLLAEASARLKERAQDLTADEAAFIEASRTYEQAVERRWARYRAVAVGVIAVALLVMTLMAVRNRRAAARAEQQARETAALVEAGDRSAGGGDLQAGIASYSDALKASPDNTTALLRRGALYDQRGEFAAAIDDLTRVIALTEPDTTPAGLKLLGEAHLARGLSYLHANQPRRALADLDEAAAHNPKDPVILASRGAVLERLGRDREALDAYSASLSARADPDVSFSRGVLHQKLGNRDQATADFRAVAASANASPQAQEAARARLATLGTAPPAAVVERQPEQTRVFVHVTDAGDRRVANAVLKALADRRFGAQGVELVKVSVTNPETRFFVREDERLARDVREIAEGTIAAAGFNIRLDVRYVATSRQVAAGTIEIWLPSLTEGLSTFRNRVQSKY
jgi:tetratricopeptide (TPR) repeat protein